MQWSVHFCWKHFYLHNFRFLFIFDENRYHGSLFFYMIHTIFLCKYLFCEKIKYSSNNVKNVMYPLQNNELNLCNGFRISYLYQRHQSKSFKFRYSIFDVPFNRNLHWRVLTNFKKAQRNTLHEGSNKWGHTY